MASFVLDFWVIAAVVNLEYTSAIPSYATSFMGHEYWNTRCDMNYVDDWLGYWNNENRRTEYKRYPQDSLDRCPCDSCSNRELQCSTFTGTNLYAYAFCINTAQYYVYYVLIFLLWDLCIDPL